MIGKILEIVNKQKKYFEEYDDEFWEVTLKNVTGNKLKRVRYEFCDDTIQEIYDINPNEEYKVIAFTKEENFDISVISTEFEIPNIYGQEFEITANISDGKIVGSIKNNSQRTLYPNQVIILFKDNTNNSIYQKTIEYAGCFDKEKVIKSGDEFSFEMEVPENTSFISQKGITFKYSDLEFKEYQIYTQYDIKM